MKLMSLMIDVVEKTSQPMTFGILAGIALVLLAIFIGFAFIMHGWPNWFNKKK